MTKTTHFIRLFLINVNLNIKSRVCHKTFLPTDPSQDDL